MSVDILMLVYSAVLTWLLVAIAATGSIQAWGVAAAAGNREGLEATSGWAGRAGRAAANAKENLLIFGALVLAASVSGAANEATALGATVFFWARVAHAGLYLAGVAWLRTAAWMAGVAGMAMILIELIS